jgi:poly-gamma-glutamate synthesis protein (capsule biosynthesis protein)
MRLILAFYIGLLLSFPIVSIENLEKVEKIQEKIFVPDRFIRTKRGKRLEFPSTSKLLFAGDTMFNWGVREAIDSSGYEQPFEEWFPIFNSVDLRFLNLETPLLKKEISGTKDKSYVFFGLEKDIQLLENLRVDAVMLGNNHSMDFDAEGLFDTIQILDKANIQHIGAGKDFHLAFEPITIHRKENTYVLYSASEVGERHLYAKGNSPGIAYFHESIIAAKIKSEKLPPTNHFAILNLHWGWEYSPEPTIGQRRSAYKMLDAGFHAIVGHHTHIPQGIEIYKGKPIIYSLGNFVFGSKNVYLNHNIVVVLHFNESEISVIEIIPAFGKFQNQDHYFYPLDPKEAEEFLLEYAILCKKLNTDLSIQGGRGYVFLDKSTSKKE